MTMPNDHEHAGCGEVVQEDREEAAIFLPVRDRGDTLMGKYDHLFAVQAFARHRRASVAALTAEVERVRAETAEACAKVAANGADLHRRSSVKDWRDGYETACNYIAHAIRHLGPDRRK